MNPFAHERPETWRAAWPVTVYLDLDGVLADFISGAMNLFAYDMRNYPLGHAKPFELVGLTEDEFTAKIRTSPHFWARLPAFEWTREVCAILTRQPRAWQTWEIIVGPGMVPDYRVQREEWLSKHLGQWFTRYRMGIDKLDLARPGALLVDDNPSACRDFELRGGRAVVFPSRTHKEHPVPRDVAEWLTVALKKRIAEPPGLVQSADAVLDLETERAIP